MSTDKEKCELELFEITERLGLDRFERRSYLELKLGRDRMVFINKGVLLVSDNPLLSFVDVHAYGQVPLLLVIFIVAPPIPPPSQA